MTQESRTISRILRVNHAGEYGAIRIYGAQVFISKFFWRDLVAPLLQLQSHEVEHCRIFRTAMITRGARPCRTMWLWSKGGLLLGALTALMGPKAIWATTEIVERNVHKHLDDQLHFLRLRDTELYNAILEIQTEEEGHMTLAQSNKGHETFLTRALHHPISWSIDTLIWLSTQGDSIRMRRDLEASA